MKYLYVFSFFLSSLLIASPVKDHKIDQVAFAELCQVLGIPFDQNVVDVVQKRWLRKVGIERWEMKALEDPYTSRFVLMWAKENGFFDVWRPSSTFYDKAVILGATTGVMQTRLNYLKELWMGGTRFDEVVWLTGSRLLDHRVDGLIQRCNTECEAAQIIWNETELPEEMRKLPVVFVTAPVKDENGILKRPNTGDTIVAWLEKCPKSCVSLFVSNQPFCGYQFSVVNTYLPSDFTFDLVGPGVTYENTSIAAASLLDSVARWVYQESLSQ